MQALYLAFAFGAVIWCRYPTFGVAICVATAGVILFQVGFVSFLLLKFTRDTLQGDLRDIPKYYKLASLDGSDKTGGDFMPLGPRAFWVVEAKHRVTGETELAGCVGLGAFRNTLTPPPTNLKNIIKQTLWTRGGVLANSSVWWFQVGTFVGALP